MNNINTNAAETPRVPAEIEKVLKAMPIQEATEFHEWMSKGVLGLMKIPATLMKSYLAAKSKLDKDAALTTR